MPNKQLLKIVIVDNDEDEQLFMKEGFISSGHFKLAAQLENGDELFHWLEEHQESLPDLILSDLNMHGKNGYDILSEIGTKAAFKHIPVVITSTSQLQSVADKCLSLGAAAYMVKPDTFVDYREFAQKAYQLMLERLEAQ